jgi:ABC-type Fe3+/spermidine/putrescine transport system ATPase subunit
VSKTYDGRRVVSDITIEIEGSEFIAVVGPSGSGKTTIMRLIAGLETPDRGTVSISGEDVTFVPAERRNVNTVFQSYALFPHLSVMDNVAYGPRMRGLSRSARYVKARHMLELVRLPDIAARLPHELSGGMQQRVALARALANDPAVLLLDEPLAALDRKLRLEMQRDLRLLQKQLAATFIYVTHDQNEALGMADRIAVLRGGTFEQVGTPGDVYDCPTNAWIAQFIGDANTIPARLDHVGGTANLSSAAGQLESGFLADGLVSGDATLIVVRPEATRIERTGQPAGKNRLAAHLVESTIVGPTRRLRAVTADGNVFDSIEHRGPEPSPSVGLVPGDPVLVTFDSASVRAYRPENVV